MTFEKLVEAVWHRRVALLAVLMVGAFVSVLMASRVKPAYTAQATVLMVSETSAELPLGAPSPTKPILSADLPMLATTPTVLKRVALDLRIGDSPTDLQALASRIKARLGTTSSAFAAGGGVLIVGFKGSSGQSAVDGANAVASEVTAFYRDNSTQRFTTLIRDLQQQMSQRKRETEALDMRVQAVMAQHPFFEGKDGASLNGQYAKLALTRYDALAAATADEAAASIANSRPTQVIAAAFRDIIEGDPTYRSLRERFERDSSELQHVRGQYSRTYPGLPELTKTVESDREAMLAREVTLRAASPNASATYVAALGEVNRSRAQAAAGRAKLKALDQALAVTQAQLNDSRSSAAGLATLQRRRDAATTAYNVLARRLADAEANKAEAGSVGSVNMLDRAVYASPSLLTSPFALAVAGIAFTIGLAFATLFLLEAFGHPLLTPASVENLYGVPIIASIR